jgi:hypothetical protein
MSDITNISASDKISDSRAVINTNFTNLNTDKITISEVRTDEQVMEYGISRQAIINGNFNIWQRATSGTIPDVTSTFIADRWYDYIGKDGGTLPTITRSREALTAGDIPNSFYYSRLTTDGSGTSLGVNSAGAYIQRIEQGTRFLCGDGKKVTISFYARSSIENKRISVTGFQTYGTGGSPSSVEFILSTPITLTSSWTKYTVTLTTNTLVGKTFGTSNNDYLGIYIYSVWGTTYGNTYVYPSVTAETFGGSGTLDIAQVQVCAGDLALPFQPKHRREELNDCHRFCQVITSQTNEVIGIGSAASTIGVYVTMYLKQTMRAIPTLTATATDWKVSDLVAGIDLTDLSFDDATIQGINQVTMRCTVASGLTQFRPYFLQSDGTAERLLIFNAEL